MKFTDPILALSDAIYKMRLPLAKTEARNYLRYVASDAYTNEASYLPVASIRRATTIKTGAALASMATLGGAGLLGAVFPYALGAAVGLGIMGQAACFAVYLAAEEFRMNIGRVTAYPQQHPIRAAYNDAKLFCRIVAAEEERDIVNVAAPYLRADNLASDGRTLKALGKYGYTAAYRQLSDEIVARYKKNREDFEAAQANSQSSLIAELKEDAIKFDLRDDYVAAELTIQQRFLNRGVPEFAKKLVIKPTR
jgi:hypothetical protein